VLDAAVIGVPDETMGRVGEGGRPVRPGEDVTEEELIPLLWRAPGGLQETAVDRFRSFDGELPRDAAGKLLKRKIREPYWAATGRLI